MRVLFDENVDRRLKRFFDVEHEVSTVASRSWKGKKNGELLNLAQGEFDVFLTRDQNIPYQQNLSRFDIAVVVLQARSNAYEDLAPLVEKASAALPETRPGHALFGRGIVSTENRNHEPTSCLASSPGSVVGLWQA